MEALVVFLICCSFVISYLLCSFDIQVLFNFRIYVPFSIHFRTIHVPCPLHVASLSVHNSRCSYICITFGKVWVTITNGQVVLWRLEAVPKVYN